MMVWESVPKLFALYTVQKTVQIFLLSVSRMNWINFRHFYWLVMRYYVRNKTLGGVQ